MWVWRLYFSASRGADVFHHMDVSQHFITVVATLTL